MVNEPCTTPRYTFTLFYTQIFFLQHKNIFDQYIATNKNTCIIMVNDGTVLIVLIKKGGGR